MTSNDKQIGGDGKTNGDLKNSDLNDEDRKDNHRRGPTQQTQLITIAMKCELWDCPERNAYATIRVDDYCKNWKVGERLEPPFKANIFLPEIREREMSHAA